ncbi:MAG: YegP family protein [Pseudomonadota bacterium]|nr:YegP family protein [Pseudomonadota bacterium]
MGKFLLWQSSQNYQWYFRLVASNGETVSQSEGYTTKQGAQNGIAAVKRYAPTAPTQEA